MFWNGISRIYYRCRNWTHVHFIIIFVSFNKRKNIQAIKRSTTTSPTPLSTPNNSQRLPKFILIKTIDAGNKANFISTMNLRYAWTLVVLVGLLTPLTINAHQDFVDVDEDDIKWGVCDPVESLHSILCQFGSSGVARQFCSMCPFL